MKPRSAGRGGATLGGLLLAAGVGLAACGGDETSSTGTGTGGADGAGGSATSATSTGATSTTSATSATGTGGAGGGTSAGTGGAGGAKGGCERFEYEASGTGTCDEGCSYQCDCPDSFPTSVAKCTEDGCIVAGNCEEICKAKLSEAVGCASTYTVQEGGTGGAGGSGG